VVEQLLIGDVTALTGIAAGRIRHYEKIGLLSADHLRNGYRVFDVETVLDPLRIDLLRSLGVSIKDIGRSLDSEQTTLADLLDEHRALLVTERDRLDRLIEAIDAATASGLVTREGDGDESDVFLRRLATSHRDSIGVIGRLTTPLSPAVAAMYSELFGEWELPVPPLFGQMLLPPAASTLMEKLARAPGRSVLWDRLRTLAVRVAALHEDDDAAVQLAHAWVDEQVDNPLPDDVIGVLRSVQPLLEHDPVIVFGFHTWASSITPSAARFLDEVADVVARRGLVALRVIVLPAATSPAGPP
jgi:DNA-binding transcriptional MerR regulator